MSEQLHIPGLALTEYALPDGRVLHNVHEDTACMTHYCTIHHHSKHAKSIGPQHWRDDRGIMERICEHGVGHPDPDSPWPENDYRWVHGCDGCC